MGGDDSYGVCSSCENCDVTMWKLNTQQSSNTRTGMGGDDSYGVSGKPNIHTHSTNIRGSPETPVVVSAAVAIHTPAVLNTVPEPLEVLAMATRAPKTARQKKVSYQRG